ncbi:MAG: peptidoglycan-binding protein, partial [Clostridia bacterium]|nr:peptidoglycan-binding protein [Clostridia bacterium]
RSFPRIPLLAVDGIYGPETAEAVRVFQELFGLSPTGEVDSTTWEALGREYRRVIYPTTRPEPIYPFLRGDRVLEIGDTGPTVALLQALLDTLALQYRNIRPVTATGQFDTATEEAVKQLQTLFGYEPVGRVDRRTWDMLARTYNAYVGR